MHGLITLYVQSINKYEFNKSYPAGIWFNLFY
jgi:hypothetical protein